jgi:hypothetical protein
MQGGRIGGMRGRETAPSEESARSTGVQEHFLRLIVSVRTGVKVVIVVKLAAHPRAGNARMQVLFAANSKLLACIAIRSP